MNQRSQALLHAGQLLWQAWQEQGALQCLPDGCRPLTRAEGYLVQAGLEARSAGPILGWKIAATSVAGQRHIQVDGPMAGRLLRERAVPGGSQLSLAGNRMAVAEPEFAFRMGRDLAPRATPYSAAEVLDAAQTLHPAIEVPNSRFAEFTSAGEAQLIADNACAHQFVLGEAAPDDWRGLDLAAHAVHNEVSGPQRRYARAGIGSAVLGHPLDALAWLANELSSLGITLARGQVVTTGACAVPLEVLPGDRVRSDFGVLGVVTVEFV